MTVANKIGRLQTVRNKRLLNLDSFYYNVRKSVTEGRGHLGIFYHLQCPFN